MIEPFAAFVDHLLRALARPLPGPPAQLRLAPTPDQGWRPDLRPPGARAAAVLLAIYPRSERATFVLTRRPPHLPSHGGQVSLPGGRLERGEDPEEAARREAVEELGPALAAARTRGRLSPLWVPVSGYRITPVVATLDVAPRFEPSKDEVESIHEIDVADLLDPAHRRTGLTIRRDGGERNVPWLDLGGQTVWGATGMILAEFAELLEAL